MKFTKFLLAFALCQGLYAQGQEQLITVPEPTEKCASGCCSADNTQSPAGVSTDHIHPKGTWMLTYTYIDNQWSGFQSRVPSTNLTTTYMMLPQKMDMGMHMLMGMYGITNRLTVMAMTGYTTCNMGMSMAGMYMLMHGTLQWMPASTMYSASAGITDSRVSLLYNFSRKSTRQLIASLGIDLPTGSIHSSGTTILGDNQRLTYDMQPGTGSVSIDPDVTYTRKFGKLFAGANGGAMIRTNFNELGYKVGNQFHLSAWGGYQLLKFMSTTIRAEDLNTDRIAGFDKAINTDIYLQNDPTADIHNYGGNIVNGYLGLNFHFPGKVIQRFRLMAEYGVPLNYTLNGSQMAPKSTLVVDLRYAL